MAVTTQSSTGANTSGNLQAAVKVTSGGCITEALKDALESQLIIEFPDALDSAGNVDVLSSIAVNQIVSQLVVSTEFQNFLVSAITTDPTLSTIVETLLASAGFTTALNDSIDEKLEDSAVVEGIGQSLLNTDSFVTGMIDAMVSSSVFTTAVQTAIDSYLATLNLFTCSTQTYTVVAGNVVEVPVANQTDNDYWFNYQVIAYDNSVGGGSSSNGSFIVNRTPSAVTINFPNALPGDTVTLYHLTQSCRI